jgi:hypothetical protein
LKLLLHSGHSSTRAALIYLHGGDQRQRAIADTVRAMVQEALASSLRSGQGRRELARKWRVHVRVLGQVVWLLRTLVQ